MDYSKIHEFYDSLFAIDQMRCNGFKELSLSTPQCILLSTCKQYTTRHNSLPKPSQISELIHAKPAAITPILNKLEDAGLIERQFSKKDRREVYIKITEKGEAEFEAIHKALVSYYLRMISVVGEENIELLKMVAKKIEEFNIQESQSTKAQN